MPLLNKTFLNEIGITLTPAEEKALSEQYEATLNDRVTTEIVESLTPAQLGQLEQYKNAPDDQLQQWLVANVPSLNEIIEDEVAILLGEIAENSDKF